MRRWRIGRLQLDARRWSVSWVYEVHTDGQPRLTGDLFALRCMLCRRFTLGCRDHWFCGLCEACRAKVEDAGELDDDAEV